MLQDHRQDWTYWITGGLGSGKTYGGAWWFVQRMFDNYKSKYSWCIAPNHTKVESIMIPALTEVLLNHYGLQEHVDYTITGSKPRTLELHKTGQTVFFKSANQWRLMIGDNISHWWATECGYYESRDWFDKTQVRTRCKWASIRQGLGEGTPEGMNYWEALANIQDEDALNLFKRVILWTDDNPHLPASFVDKLVRTYEYDAAKLKSYRFGEFTPFTKGTAYWEFFESRNVKLDLEAEPLFPIAFAWDFNRAPLAWCALQRQRQETRQGSRFKYRVVAESSGKARGLVDAVAEFIMAFPPSRFQFTPIHIFGDASGWAGSHKQSACDYEVIYNLLKTKYRTVEHHAQRSNPEVRTRLERINQAFAYELVDVAAWCRNTIRSLTQTRLKDGTFEIEKPKDDTWTHYADALGYAIYEMTKHEDFEAPGKPRIHGINEEI